MNEFDLIARYFVPLAEPFSGSLSLKDDAALLDVPAGMQMVVTKDAISEGVHFMGNEDPALIARKLLRTNLSDLAAKGAAPWCYFLNIALPSLNEQYIARFAAGLAEDQTLFSIHLAGGDTIKTKGAATFSLTALGLVPKGEALLRSGAKIGDTIYVTGTLGDAALGLEALRRNKSEPLLIERYHLPQPRMEFGASLRGRAHSCMDISDGLLQDMNHICNASKVGAEIHRERLPLSDAAQNWLAGEPALWPLIYSGGDDYELLFTSSQEIEGATAIGKITASSGVKLLNEGKDITPKKLGYSHS